ncbi:MAG TPA: NAD(P)H-hydrate dehydratase, partial [Candidatus Nitrosotenuis sp.]|nr:NAD(P)H-hydrate dehydratase [Candidatus Nitrosotenuis sp.]
MAQKLTASLARKFIPPRKTDSRKGQNGKVLVVGGSYMYHGAPILASLSALRSGTDLVYTAVPK